MFGLDQFTSRAMAAIEAAIAEAPLLAPVPEWDRGNVILAPGSLNPKAGVLIPTEPVGITVEDGVPVLHRKFRGVGIRSWLGEARLPEPPPVVLPVTLRRAEVDLDLVYVRSEDPWARPEARWNLAE